MLKKYIFILLLSHHVLIYQCQLITRLISVKKIKNKKYELILALVARHESETVILIHLIQCLRMGEKK
jgi:hypothetical protein